MIKIISYHTPQEFLDASLFALEKKEVENNLIIGICNGFKDKNLHYAACTFINAFLDGKLLASSIKTLHKAIITSCEYNEKAIEALASFYKENKIEVAGVVGDEKSALQFSHAYGKAISFERTMFIHELIKINELPKVDGLFEKATMDDHELISSWTVLFEEDANNLLRTSFDALYQTTKVKIERQEIFKWLVKGKLVSIAAVVRKTKNTAIVGLVFTPKEYRFKGYASACVQALSQHILNQGYQKCALFTDKGNPTSNSIYKKIGYEIIASNSDIIFE